MNLLITAPVMQGFITAAGLTSNDPKLEFPSPALQPRIALPLDALVRESFSKRNEVTSDPVEDGEDVNAHVVRKPDTLTIDGIVSDTPVTLDGVTATNRPANGIVKAAIAFFDALVEIRQPFDFVGSLYYKGYIFTEWTVTKSSRDGSWLHFTATMQRLKIVASQIVSGKNLSPAGNGSMRHGGKTNKGTVETKPTSSVQDQVINSFRDPQTGYLMGG